MKFKTGIIKKEKVLELIGKATFSESLFWVLKNKQPTPEEAQLIDAILVACAEHGVEAPSAFVPRVVVSTGNTMNAALAAGALAIGDWHGGAIEKCAQMLQSGKDAKTIVSEALTKKERLSGYGHKIYKDADPRATAIYAVAEKLGKMGNYMKLARDIEKELTKFPLNIDGAIAAVISELGFDWRLGKAFFVLGRMPGMIAHIYEEMTNEKPYRRLEEDEVEYIER